MWRIGSAAVAAGLALSAPPVAGQDRPAVERRSVWSGVFVDQQAERASAAFSAQCSVCHGEDMHGGAGAPSLVGPEFLFTWKGKSVGELLTYVHANMPPGQAGSLSDQQYADIVARILKANDFPSGPIELPPSPAGSMDVIIQAKD